MIESPTDRSARAWVLLISVVAAAFMLVFAAVASRRLGYPFELEWLEGAGLAHLHRVLAGQALYVPPSLDFVPLNYTPLYFYVAALPARLFGEGFLALRLVSMLASLASFALLFTLVRRETGRASAGLAAAGLYAATYRLSGGWFDIARADSLHLCLVLGAIAVLRLDRHDWRASIVASALLALAFFTRQSAALIAVPLVLHALFTNRRRFAGLMIGLAILAGGGVLALDLAHHGWFRFYVFDVLRKLPMEPSSVPLFWIRDLQPLAIAITIAALALATSVPDAPRGRRSFYGGACAGLIASSWLLRSYPGGYPNVIMPAFAAIALLTGVGWAAVLDFARDSALPFRGLALRAAGVALLVQFAMLSYDPRNQLPTAADRAAGEKLVAALRAIPGDVLVPSHGDIAMRAGKGVHFDAMSFEVILLGAPERVRAPLISAWRDALRRHRYAAIVLDQHGSPLRTDVEAWYRPAGSAFESPDVGWPVAGAPLRPETIMVPREPGDPAAK